MFIKSVYGWLMGFDGEDYTWTQDRAKAWLMRQNVEWQLAVNRLEAAKTPGLTLVVPDNSGKI